MNRDFTQKLIFITEPWNETTKAYDPPWQLKLSAQPWRVGEFGEVCPLAAPVAPDYQENQVYINPPLCATMPPTFIEATREKEIKAMLKFGRDSNWPLSVTFASV
jgi:hypothetical protein